MPGARGCGIVVIAVTLAGTVSAAPPPPQRRATTVASPGTDPWVSRSAKLQVRPQRSADAPLQVEFPTKDWMVLPSSGALVLAAASRKGDAVVLIERSTLRQALDPADITDLFAQIEIEAIKERQPKAADFVSKVLDSGARRLVAVQYSRPGVLGSERVRQYLGPGRHRSLPGDLHQQRRAVCRLRPGLLAHCGIADVHGIGNQVTQPTKIGRYEVIERVGRGGMGAVYLGRDTVLEREVAIKVMSADFAADETSRPRFYREARAAAKLQHRNIVTIFEFGEEDDTPFIVMEFLRGQDVAKRMRAEPPLTLEQKIDIIAELCTGLHFAHEQGVIHRDVKPANIWLVPDGSVKLLDFGIAKFSSSTMTRQGSVLGSISYMPPEQINGLEVDGRADVFCGGRRALRTADRQEAVRRRVADRGARADHGRRAGARRGPAARPPEAAGRGGAQGLAEGP